MMINVVRVESETPRLTASKIVGEDDRVWTVECEGTNCDRQIDVAKKHWRPVDYRDFNFDAPHVEVQITAPGAMRCITCGPFGVRRG